MSKAAFPVEVTYYVIESSYSDNVQSDSTQESAELLFTVVIYCLTTSVAMTTFLRKTLCGGGVVFLFRGTGDPMLTKEKFTPPHRLFTLF